MVIPLTLNAVDLTRQNTVELTDINCLNTPFFVVLLQCLFQSLHTVSRSKERFTCFCRSTSHCPRWTFKKKKNLLN